MTKSIIFTFLGLLFCLSAIAQTSTKTKKDVEDFATRQTEMMTKNLSLTPDEVAKVKKINLDYAKEIYGASNEELKKLDKERDTELKKVLTNSQYRKWEDGKKDWLDELKAAWEKTKKKTEEVAKDVKDKVEDLTE